MNIKAKLILEDGTIFVGKSFGAPISTAGEVVFATGMVGYEQSLTDPSYCGQILTFTYPLIGNWGVPPKNYWESEKIQISGLVISDLTTNPHHHLMEQTLDQWLKAENIPGICDIDTRKLTQKLRERGVMLGKIVTGNQDIDFWNPNAENLVSKVSPEELVVHRPSRIPNTKYQILNTGVRIGLLNCGAKRNILRNLLARGATVYELPWDYDPFETDAPDLTPGVKSDPENIPGVDQSVQIPKIDGLVISNGPGDPKMAKESIEIIKKALKRKIPTFGICLGNQLLALAAGGDTFKLKFGHRAQNQPTIDIFTKHCYITTQNHGFAVSEKKLPDGFKRWFYNANDNTNEGIIHEKLPFWGVQFHPEAAPGPTDTEFLFDFFMEKFK